MWDYLLGVGVTLFTYSIGYLVGHYSRAKQPDTVEPICGCDHHISMHEGRTGRCRERSRLTDQTCRCQNYVGPEPVSSIAMLGLAELPRATEE